MANESNTANVLHWGPWAIRHLMRPGWGAQSQRHSAFWCYLVQPRYPGYCSASAYPELRAQNPLHSPDHSLEAPEGPSPCRCSPGTMTYSCLLRFFPPWAKKARLLFLSSLPHQESHHCWTVVIISRARGIGRGKGCHHQLRLGPCHQTHQCDPKRLRVNY